MKQYRLPTLLIIVLLCFASGLVVAQDATPLYAVQGPYSVGRTWFSVSNGTEKPLILVAWYPALKQEGDQQGATLTIPDEYNFPNIKETGNWGSATLNAAPDRSKAPYPLVIFSTGFKTTPKDYFNIEQHLASYGFIVVAAFDPDEALWSSFMARPMVTPHEIDFAENLTRQDGSFKGFIDTKHVGVVGHSQGGYTALAAAGAQFNMPWFEIWCADHKGTVGGDFVCLDLLPHKENMLALAQLDSMPTALWPSWGDPRVSAIVGQSSAAFVFGSSGLAAVTIPTMIMFGSNDQLITPDWAGYKTYESISSTQKSQVVFENGNHVIFNQGGGDIEPDGWDMGRAHDLINHFTTAFLLDKLKDDQEAHQALLPDAVNFANITYSTTMK